MSIEVNATEQIIEVNATGSTIDINVSSQTVDVNATTSVIEVTASYNPGINLPIGGATGQVLKKQSNTDYDTYWAADEKGVPYIGATGDVDLGEYELKAGQIELDQSPTGTAGVAVTRWNDAIGSTETTLKGGNVILKNGVDLIARVVNKVTPNTTLTKAAYQAVKISGAQGQRLAVALAQANNDNNSADTLGLVTETIPTNQEGFIMTVGSLEGINTTGSLQGETWSDGDVLYLSPTTPGAITKVKPNGSTGHIVVIGYVEYAHQNNGKIYVKIMNGWELDELHNVFISSPANNDALIYESATSLWKNKSIATALGYTPGTVSSVALSVPTGLVVTGGSPITTSGTIAVALQSGYSIPTTVKQGNWDDAYTFVSGFPSQTGNSGKYLTTDGSTLSWGTVSTANIYNSDGTLTGNRTLTQSTFSLTFAGTTSTRFHSTGNLTIGGTTDAGFKLDIVGGNARINGLQIGIGNGTITTNTAFGLNAMYLGTVTGIQNTAIGRFSLRNLTTGEYNTAIGADTMANLTNGARNTVVGYGSGNISGGGNNTVVGSFAGTSINAGSGNIFIGYTAGYVLNGVSNVLSINSKTLTAVDEPTNAIIYGVQNATLSNQILRLNARTGIGLSADPVASAQFQIDSITRGFLQPRMTTTQRDAIVSPATGLSVYNTTTNTSDFYNGTSWVSLAAGNIYTADGTLTGNRTVTSGGFNLTFTGSNIASGAIARGLNLTHTLVAAANNDVLVGLDINPTFTNGAFTGVQNIGLRLNSNSSGTTENLQLYNANNGGGSATSIRFRNGYTGSGQGVIWSAVDFVFAAGGGGNLLLKTSTGLGVDATTKMTIGTNSITSNSVHSFSSGILGDLNVYVGSQGDPVAGTRKIMTSTVSGSFATPVASLAIGNSSSLSANLNAFGVYINNTATVSGTGARYNLFAVGTSLNSLEGNTIIGGTVDSGFKLDVQGTGRFTGNITAANSKISLGTGAFSDPVIDFTASSKTSYIGVVQSAGSFINAGGTGDNFIRSQDNTRFFYFGSGSGGASFFRFSYSDASIIIDGNGTGNSFTTIPSSQLTVNSTTKGFLPPRMTSAQRTAISSPAVGLIVYQTDATEGLYEYASTGWRILYNTPSGGSGITRSVNVISTTQTAGSTATTDYVYLVSGTTTITMPTAVGNTNRYTIKNVGTNTITINTTSSQTIDGSTSITMAVRYTALDVISDGTNWNII